MGRLFTFIGSRILPKTQYAVASFIDQALNERAIRVTGNPLTRRSYLSAKDMGTWLYKALILPVPYVDLSIGSSEAVTIGELATFIGTAAGKQVFFDNSLSDGDIYVPDNRITMAKLGVLETQTWKDSVLELLSQPKVGV
jgi:nucleoside-diphosphate-sugar epimerase